MIKKIDLFKEFDRQIENLIQKNYPKAVGIKKEEFLKMLEPLKEKIGKLSVSVIDFEEGKVPFVIVIKDGLITPETAMSLVRYHDKEGVTKLYPHNSEDFKPVDEFDIPSSKVYILVDIDRGKETLNIAPSKALKIIIKKNRSPLTIDEGVALITHFPEFLIKNNCFSLLASRHAGDQRVPAIWINAQKQPNLGWCWDGNPHTWLGSASGQERIGYK